MKLLIMQSTPVLCSETPSACVLFSMWVTKFHTSVKQEAKLQFRLCFSLYIFGWEMDGDVLAFIFNGLCTDAESNSGSGLVTVSGRMFSE